MKTRRIESPANPAVKEALDVLRGRRSGGHEFMIEGPNLVEAALRSSATIALVRVFYSEKFRDRSLRLLKRIAGSGAELVEVSGRVMERLSGTETPRGLVALARWESPGLGDLGHTGIVVVLDGIQDPGNLGTIIRTSDAAGASAVVVLEGSCDPFSPKALRASAGSVFNIPVARSDTKSFMAWLEKSRLPLAATSGDATTSIYEASLVPPLAIAFGNEASGVSPALRERANITVRVPVIGRAESLNVSAAAAACLYEALRQSGKSGGS